MEIMSAKGLSKSFGKKEVIKNINISIKKGEILGIVGPSGSGKSVLIKCLIGFLKPDLGEIIIKPKTTIGFSMQNNSLYNYLSVKQNLKYFAKLYGVSRKETKNKIGDY
ncbi:MAG: ATP-binding cassette domain-containing protein [archaeon]